MSLAPQIAEILERSRGAPGRADMTIAEARKAEAARFAGLPVPGERRANFVERTVPGPDGDNLAIRVYRPPARARLPIVVYFHSGGWVVGGLAVSDRFCRKLAAVTGCIVVAVEYRLAPEHKFPAAVEDAHAATRWVLAHAADLVATRSESVSQGKAQVGTSPPR